ncbi:MAG: methyltransferase, partial [Firmicutes bacterium]|nr:methyltransferase [Bacillota bacterium]
MEILQNGFTLEIAPGCFPLSTDSIALSEFVRLPPNARVLDLGSGSSALGMLLCAADPRCRVTGLEIDPAAHACALENIRRNSLQSRLESILADLRTPPAQVVPGSFDCCVSNPPYFSGGPDSAVPLARRNDCCSTESLFTAAGRALKFGGDFFLVHKPEHLAEICRCAAAAQLEPKRLRLLRHRPGQNVSLILLSCRKGGKPGLFWEERTLYDASGAPTEYYR